MRRTANFCATAVAVALLGGLAPPSTAAGDATELPSEAFHKIVQSLIDAENREDAAAMAALFTQDAILLPPGGGEPIQGEDNIRQFLDRYAKRKMDNHKITSTVLLMGGAKSVIDAGTWSGDVPGENGGQATHVTGTYLAVGILVDGKWKLWANSWQAKPAAGAVGSSVPPQAGTSAPNR